jgi:hypothetical protein
MPALARSHSCTRLYPQEPAVIRPCDVAQAQHFLIFLTFFYLPADQFAQPPSALKQMGIFRIVISSAL